MLLTFHIDSVMTYFPRFETKKGVVALQNIGLAQHAPNRINPHQDGQQQNQVKARLSLGIHAESGAIFYTPFFIYSYNSTQGYWFIHLSNHFRARDEMMRLHWKKHTHFIHQGDPGLEMPAYNPRKDPNVTGQLAFNFDNPARLRSIEKLNEDIPRYIFDKVGATGIALETFLNNKFNDTPAHVGMIKDVLGEAIRANNIWVCNHKGGYRQKGNTIDPKDIIVANPQLRLFQ